MLAVGVNGTAIMAALPTMQTELALGPSGAQWAINAYLVVSGACIVLGGLAADRFGARRTAMVGLALFAAASTIIAMAAGESTLIAARALQGLAAAFAVPSTLADVRVAVPPERQGSAIGAWTGFLMLGFSVGPLIGGALTHLVNWRTIFWLNVALVLSAIVGLSLSGPVIPQADSQRRRPVDWLGFVLLGTFMVSLIFALHALPHAASASGQVIGPFVLSVAALMWLLKVELRSATPLFDVRFFTQRAFAIGVVIGSLSMLSIMSFLLYYNLYAQSREGFGLSALEAGASLLPLCVTLLVAAISASAIAARVGLRATATMGMALVVLGCATIGVGTTGRGFVLLAIGLLLLGAGFALPYAIAPRIALSALSSAQGGQGSGMVNACTFLGGSIGVAGGSIAFARGGLVAVLAMLVLVGIVGAVLGRCIPERA
jgi:MFS family permease